MKNTMQSYNYFKYLQGFRIKIFAHVTLIKSCSIPIKLSLQNYRINLLSFIFSK